MAQGDLLLTITDVRGESADKDLPDSIELSGWGYTASSVWDPTTGQTVARVRVGELVVTKAVDISSPILMQFMVTNKLIDDVKLINRKAGGNRQEGFYRIELKGARVRSIVQKGASVGATMLEEVVTFGYKEITWTHTEQGSKGILEGGPTSFTFQWDTNH